ncbi:MAG: hypothetical protein M3464_02805 [Chloroflexota bacterium]|nr:hypothetical protein [Chloroflexota bacterium]
MRHAVAAISAAAFLFLTFGPTGASAQVLLDCDYFNFQEQAQAILDEDLSDPNVLDEAGDGIACPDLPSAGPNPDLPERPANGDYQCVDFAYQEMAQQILDEDASDPSNLDPTGDGIACSRLPLQADFTDEDERAARRAARDDAAAEDGDREARQAARDDATAEADPDPDAGTTEEDREARRAARQADRDAEAGE